jgi:hypothetical protein
MNVNFLKMGKTWLIVFLFLIVGVTNARADIELTDNLTIFGFLRQTATMSMGTNNPTLEAYQAVNGGKKPDFNLIRTLLQIELNYQPTEIFRLYMKTRATHDQTYMWQSDLGSYNTTPWTYEHHGSDLKTGYSEDSFMAEIWEVWANIETDLWWIRLGKQQIAWGDLPGVRIADQINPLDKSWHLTNEPEEYENIRIPEWAARVYFTFPENMSGPFEEVFIDSFWNPGDVHPDIQPSPGSPYMNAFSGGAPQPDPDFDPIRGEDEYGVRLGCNVSGFQTTLMYMSVHADFPVWDFFGAPEQAFTPWGTVYPSFDIYAMTLNYAFASPLNTSVNFEASYTPDQPWQSTATPWPSVDEGAWWRTAIYLERNVFFMNSLTRFFFPASLRFMYYRHWIDSSDEDDVKLSPAPLGTSNRLDWAYDNIYLSYTLPFGKGANWQINPIVNWGVEGSYKIQCFLKYAPNYIWRFDLGAIWQGGSSERAFQYTGSGWNDEIYMRATFMF